VHYDNTNRVNSILVPDGVVGFNAARCIYVTKTFYVIARAMDFEGGITYLNVGSPDIAPLRTGISAYPTPDSSTQTSDPSIIPPYSNPGAFANSREIEVTYAGANSPGRAYAAADLTVYFDLGAAPYADISARAENSHAPTYGTLIDGYFVRPATAANPPGALCTPP